MLFTSLTQAQPMSSQCHQISMRTLWAAHFVVGHLWSNNLSSHCNRGKNWPKLQMAAKFQLRTMLVSLLALYAWL